MSEGLSYGNVQPQAGVGDYYVNDMPQLSADFLAVQPGIFAGESGGDYRALFGFSNRPGGAWDHIDLTNMTLAEVAEFTDPNGAYAQWVRDQIGYVATPTGGYQVVGTTLRDTIERLGLDPNARYDEEMQDRIGQAIFEAQGTGAWEGYQPGATMPEGGWPQGGPAPVMAGGGQGGDPGVGLDGGVGQSASDASPYSTLTALIGRQTPERLAYQQGLDAHGQGLFSKGEDGSMNIFGRTLDDQQRQNFSRGLIQAGTGLMGMGY